MGVIIRQSARNLIFNYGGFALGAFNTLVLMPRYLSREQIGVLNTFTSYSWILATICLFGMPLVIVRFYPATEGIQRRQLIQSAATLPLLLAITAALAGLLFPQLVTLVVPNPEPIFLRYHSWIFFMVIMHVAFEIVAAILRSELRTAPPVFWREVFLRVFNLVLYLAYGAGLFDYSMLVGGFALSSAVLLLGLISHVRSKIGFNPGLHFKKEWLKYGSYNLIGASLVFVVYQLDIVMLHRYGYLNLIAVYTIAMFMASTIQLPFRAFSVVAVPVLAKAFAAHDLKQVGQIYRRSSEVMLVAGGALSLWILWCAEDFRYFLPADYRPHLVAPLGFLVLAKWLDMAMGLNGAIINQSHHYKFDIWANLILLATALVFNVLLIPSMGVPGAALATCISVFLYNVVRYVYIIFRLGIHGFGWNALHIALFYVISWWTLTRISFSGHPVALIFLKTVITALLVGIWIWVLKPSREVRVLFQNTIKSLKNTEIKNLF